MIKDLRQRYELFVRGSAESVWDAIVSGEKTPLYYYGSRVETDKKPGSVFRYLTKDGGVMIDGEVVEAHEPQRLVTTFSARWQPNFSSDPPSRVTWEITPMEGICKLTLTHDGFEGETATYQSVAAGWSLILSGLKTLVETGKPLR